MGTHSNPHKEVVGMYRYVDKKSFAHLPFPLTCPPSFVRFHSHFVWLLAKVVTEMRLDTIGSIVKKTLFLNCCKVYYEMF